MGHNSDLSKWYTASLAGPRSGSWRPLEPGGVGVPRPTAAHRTLSVCIEHGVHSVYGVKVYNI